MTNQKKITFKLNGKQSLTIPVQIKKDGQNVSSDINLYVRGFLKFNNDTMDNKVMIYPVLFSTNTIIAKNGKTTLTLLPRSEDVLQNLKEIQSRINYVKTNITNEEIVSAINTTESETVSEENTSITIQAGVSRIPYSISIELSVLDYTGTYYGNTIDSTDIEINQIDLLTHNKAISTNNLIIECYNDEEWVPIVSPILNTNTSSAEEVIIELDKLSNSVPFGASPIYDCIVETAKTMNSIDNLRKLVYILTDNDSNTSIATLDEAINYINNLNGNKKTPVIVANLSTSQPLTLSTEANITDTRDINKLTYTTGGQSKTIFSTSNSDLTETSKIFYNEAVGSLGYGTYSFVVDIGSVSPIDGVAANFTIPDTTANAEWDIEVSLDNYTYTKIKEQYAPNQFILFKNSENTEIYNSLVEGDFGSGFCYRQSLTYGDFWATSNSTQSAVISQCDDTLLTFQTVRSKFSDIEARYIKFNIILLTGFSDDVQYDPTIYPALNSVIIDYSQSKTTYLYLKTKNEELSPYQMTISVDSNNTSNQIDVGLAQSDAINWVDFQTPSQPSVRQNGKIIVPIRFASTTSGFEQEPLLKLNNFSTNTKYGSWDPYSSITIYDKDMAIIPENNYKAYSREGMIVFSYKLPLNYIDGDYRISITNKTQNKMGLQITNKSNSNPVEIYGIGKMYTTNKDLLPPIEKLPPEAKDITVLPLISEVYSPITLSYIFYDTNFDKEDTTKTRIKWYINNINISYLDGLKKWNDIEDTSDILYSKIFTFTIGDLDDGETVADRARKNKQSILKVGDKVHCTVQVSDGDLFGIQTKSNTIRVVESKPMAYGLTIKGIKQPGNVLVDEITTNTAAIALFNYYSDTNVNKSEIIWYVNDQEFKRGIYGDTTSLSNPLPDRIIPGDNSNSYPDVALRIGNEIYYQIIPNSGSIAAEAIESDRIVVRNDPPQVSSVQILPTKPLKGQNLYLTWVLFDFEIDILKDTPQNFSGTTVKWFRKLSGGSTFDEVIDTESLAQISTNVSNSTSTVSSVLTFTGQQWYAIINPSDSINYGVPGTSNIITIG